MLLTCVGAVVVLGAIAVVMIYEQTPVPTAAMAATGFSQSVVYSGNGTVIGRFGTTNRQMLTYSQLQQNHQWLIKAVLAAEDRNFFNEGGISPTGIVRAAYEDVGSSNGSLQGGSTITQEFVRQYYSGIGTQQTFSRKIKEIFVAMKVAKEKSKQWILTNYLNTIYLGDGAYGVQAAALTYFGRPVSKLSVAQAAVIAAIIQQPSTYPLPQYRAQLVNRWHYVLNGMVQMGNLTAQQAAAMKFPAPGNFVPRTVGKDVWDPYVLNMVYNELTGVYHFTKSQIYNGGYVIRTSIDDAKMAALYAGRPRHRGADRPERQLPVLSHLHARGRGPGEPRRRLYPGPVPGARLPGVEVQRDREGHLQELLQEDRLRSEHGGLQPRAGRLVVQAVRPVGRGQAGHERADQHARRVRQPLYPAGRPALDVPGRCDADDGGTRLPDPGYYPVHNDSAAENGPYTPVVAMAASINTAYADLWHTVGGAAVASIAQDFGVDTNAACITASCGPKGTRIPRWCMRQASRSARRR